MTSRAVLFDEILAGLWTAVLCKKHEFDPKDKRQQTAINPTIVFEVLSKSTESYDRGRKAENYRQLESLKAYVLISRSSPHIEIYEHHGDGFWFLTEAPRGWIRNSPSNVSVSSFHWRRFMIG